MAVKRRTGPDIPRMNDVQLLAHLLGMAGLETTAAREASHSLLDDHQDLEHVLAQRQEVLLAHPLLGENAAAFLLLLSAMMKRYINNTGGNHQAPIAPDDRESILRLLAPHFANQGFERLCAFLLGEDLRPITSLIVAQGGRAAVSCSTHRVLELVLKHRARGVILAHNHPDGIPMFSKSDIVATGILMQELSLINVPLVDHYLLAEEHIVSMRQYTRYLGERKILFPGFSNWFSPPDEQRSPEPL